MKSFFKFVFFFILAVMLWNWFTGPDIEIVYSHTEHDMFDGFWAGVKKRQYLNKKILLI